MPALANVTQVDIHFLNQLYLATNRDLAQTDLEQARILSGLSPDVLTTLAQAPQAKVQCFLAETKVLLFQARFDLTFWEQLGQALTNPGSNESVLRLLAAQATLRAVLEAP